MVKLKLISMVELEEKQKKKIIEFLLRVTDEKKIEWAKGMLLPIDVYTTAIVLNETTMFAIIFIPGLFQLKGMITDMRDYQAFERKEVMPKKITRQWNDVKYISLSVKDDFLMFSLKERLKDVKHRKGGAALNDPELANEAYELIIKPARASLYDEK